MARTTLIRDTVLFLICINVALRAVDEHYYLRRDLPEKQSQIRFEKNSKGQECVVYREDSCTKTFDGGIGQMRKERKVVWIFPSKNIVHCPVRLIKKYISLCPANYVKKPNFYLQNLKMPHPKQWYCREVVGQNRIKEVVKNLLSSANIDGYFTNHSLRRTGGSRLFQAGIVSDAVDCYQIMSEEQRETISSVIAGQNVVKVTENTKELGECKAKEAQSKTDTGECNCSCQRSHTSIGDKICEIVSKSIEENIRSGKTIIKVEIEITNE